MKTAIALLSMAALLAGLGCANGSTSVARPVKSPGAFDRNAEDGAHLAALLEDNPTAVAHAKEELGQGGGEQVAEKPEPPPVDEITPKMSAATKALEDGDDEKARTLALEVIEKDPKGQPYAYVIVGDTYLHAHDYGKALERYKEAMALDANDGWAANRAAEALTKLHRPIEARDVLKKFVDAHPDADADTLDALAWIEMDLGDLKSSEAHFKQAEVAAKNQDGEAWYGLAMIDAHRLDPVGTEKALTALFDLQPERRVVIERDPTFFRIRQWQNVKALFSEKLLAASKAAADAKAKGLPAPKTSTSAKVAVDSTSEGVELAIPNGKKKSIAESILFDFDSAKIKSGSDKTLDEIAAFLKGEITSIDFIEIEGHADSKGDPTYNLNLSLARAESVRNALVARGVDAAKLTAKGFGSFCPIADDDDAQNRRVQFAIAAGGVVVGDSASCTERTRAWLKPAGGKKVAATP